MAHIHTYDVYDVAYYNICMFHPPLPWSSCRWAPSPPGGSSCGVGNDTVRVPQSAGMWGEMCDYVT